MNIDPISDFLTRIRNALRAELRYCDVRQSKMIVAMIEILEKRGLILGHLTKADKKGGKIRIFLKYGDEREPVIQGLKRVSSPGRRYYIGKDQIPFVFDGLGIAILSTSKGVIDDQVARKEGIGGEYLCCVW